MNSKLIVEHLPFSAIDNHLHNDLWSNIVLYTTPAQLEGVIMAGMDIDQKCGIDVNAIWYLLQRCYNNSSPDKIRLLLQHKANPHTPQWGHTILEFITAIIDDCDPRLQQIQQLLQDAEKD